MSPLCDEMFGLHEEQGEVCGSDHSVHRDKKKCTFTVNLGSSCLDTLKSAKTIAQKSLFPHARLL